MKYQFENRYKQIGIAAFLVIAASMVFYYCIFHMQSLISGIGNVLKIMSPLIYGIAIAYLLSSIVNFLEQSVIFPLFKKADIELKSRGRNTVRWICVILSTVFFLLVIITLFMMIVPELIKSITSFLSSLPTYISSVTEFINTTMARSDLRPETQQQVTDYYNQALSYLDTNLLPQLQSILQNVTSGIFDLIQFFKNFFIGLIISLYILAAKEQFIAKAKKVSYAVFPGKYADFLIRSMRYTHYTFGGFISGKIIDSVIMGILCYIGTSIIGTPYALLVSVIVGVTNIIPFFGPYIGAIPCLVLILLVDPLQSLYFLIFILVLQQFDGNILGPKILGDSTGMSSFMVIVAIIIGGGFFGVPGMIVGVPVFAVIRTAFWKIIDRYLHDKQFPTEEETYLAIDRIDLDTKKQIPLHKKKRVHTERNNFFMLIWNTIIRILTPAWNFIVKILLLIIGKIGYYIIKVYVFLKKGVLSLYQKIRKEK